MNEWGVDMIARRIMAMMAMIMVTMIMVAMIMVVILVIVMMVPVHGAALAPTASTGTSAGSISPPSCALTPNPCTSRSPLRCPC